MRISIPKERRADEARVAASPASVAKFVGMGFEVQVEAGAGDGAAITDAEFQAAGASIVEDEAVLLGGADIVLKVQRPLTAEEGLDEVALFKPGAILIAHLAALQNKAQVEAYARAGIVAFALELLPRISRAQNMDILSSQSNLAGYKAVLDGAAHYGRAFPMMMTAAGTVPPAKVLVLGAGVAGLQAIATAKRLGAVIEASDVRPAVKEQIESLGAKFLDVPFITDEEREIAQGVGGYARPMPADWMRRQAELVHQRATQADIVITTALIPGRKAPVLLAEDTVKQMKPGSVVVDLAAAQGGNCPLTVADEVVERHGVILIGHTNLASMVAADASALYARNVLDFLKLIIDKDGRYVLNLEDDIVAACLMCKDGQVVRQQAA